MIGLSWKTTDHLKWKTEIGREVWQGEKRPFLSIIHSFDEEEKNIGEITENDSQHELKWRIRSMVYYDVDLCIEDTTD